MKLPNIKYIILHYICKATKILYEDPNNLIIKITNLLQVMNINRLGRESSILYKVLFLSSTLLYHQYFKTYLTLPSVYNLQSRRA